MALGSLGISFDNKAVSERCLGSSESTALALLIENRGALSVGRSPQIMLWFRNGVYCFCILAICSDGASGSEGVLVELQTGQRLRATSLHVDPQDSNRLSLVIAGNSIQIRRDIAWNRIVRIEAAQSMLGTLTIPEHIEAVSTEDQMTPIRELSITSSTSADEQIKAVKAFVGERSGVMSRFALVPVLNDFPVPADCDCSDETIQSGHCGEPVSYAPGVVIGIRGLSSFEAAPIEMLPPQASELVAEARSFNRSGLADWDSLELLVQGRTTSGQPCPVRGLLRCSLWGRRQAIVSTYGGGGMAEPREIALLGQWSQPIEAYEADQAGVQRVVLPLGPRLPDLDLNWSDYGLLAVEIDIPGQGRLATSTEPIQLRQLGPIRARSVQEFGTPFLPHQSTSGNVRAIGLWPQSLSSLRPDRRLFSVQP